jgi:hypothetical protein
VAQFAHGLIDLGLARGEGVAIYLDKRLETVIASFGVPAARGMPAGQSFAQARAGRLCPTGLQCPGTTDLPKLPGPAQGRARAMPRSAHVVVTCWRWRCGPLTASRFRHGRHPLHIRQHGLIQRRGVVVPPQHGRKRQERGVVSEK